MRKLALILALALFMTLLCSCDIGDVSEIEDIGSIIGIGSLSYTPLKDKFELVDHSQRLPLYYYSYGGDYQFDRFLSRGGADSTASLVIRLMDLFPDVRLDMGNLGYGCSAFSARDKGGDWVMGRNFDMTASESGTCLLVHTAPRGGYESLSMVNLGFIGISGKVDSPIDNPSSPLHIAPYLPLDGINEKGVSICVLQLNYDPIDARTLGVKLTPTTIIRNVLDHAYSLESALDIFRKADLKTEGYAYHFMIADASGKSAVVEYVDNRLEIIYKTGDVLACANQFISARGRSFYKVREGNESDARVNAIDSAIRSGKFDLKGDKGMDALLAARVTNTRWSILYNLSKREMTLCLAGDAQKQFTYTLD